MALDRRIATQIATRFRQEVSGGHDYINHGSRVL